VKLTGRYSDRNRLQIIFALLTFSFCSYWTLHPHGFHLLDGFTIFVALISGPLCDLNFPFNITAGFAEIVFLLVNTGIPLLLIWLFKRSGSDFMSSLTIFWCAYACQMWFRFFSAIIYRTPAILMFCLSLAFLFLALISCFANAESSADPDFTACFDEMNETEKKT